MEELELNKFNIPVVIDWHETKRDNIIYKRIIPDIWKTNIIKRCINNRIYSIMIIIDRKYK